MKTLRLLLVLFLLLLLWLLFRQGRRYFGRVPPTAAPVTTPVPTVPRLPSNPAAAPAAPRPIPTPPTKMIPAAVHKPTAPIARPAPSPPTAKPAAPPSSIPKPPPIVLHKELIPKDITIVRLYCSQEIAGPEMTVDFDIDGSGFNTEFARMIRVEVGGLDLSVKNLQLVTANQIHGQIEIGPEATTEYIYPQVLIHNLPVFRAEEPLGIVRKGEVLNTYFIAMAEDGRSGRFRVITNLDETLVRQFKVRPSTDTLDLMPLEAHLPYAMEGVVQIGPGVQEGVFGLIAYLGQREIFRNDQMIHIVHPNIGETGLAQRVTADQPFRRPGDTIDITLHGTGFTANDAASLKARVNETDMGTTGFTWVSETEMHGQFRIPTNAAEGTYTVSVNGLERTINQKKTIFTIVPPNWTDHFELQPKAIPGHNGHVLLRGRDITPAFASGLTAETDDPGLELSPFRYQDPTTLVADLKVDPKVPPGDYLIHLSYQGQPVKPQAGNVIKISPN